MKIIIADDHAMFRDGIREILLKTSFISEVDEASSGEELLGKFLDKQYDLILLDIGLPGKRGLEILKEIQNIHPGTRVIMLSMHSEKRYAVKALKANASGYVTKDVSSEELIKAIQKVLAGKKYISENLAEEIAGSLYKKESVSPHENLSERETTVLLKIAEGKKIKEIAAELNIGSSTVSTYRARILEKLNLHSDADIIRYAIDNKLIE
jgi:two-component system, NarL family, invasion response regulator UvrY